MIRLFASANSHMIFLFLFVDSCYVNLASSCPILALKSPVTTRKLCVYYILIMLLVRCSSYPQDNDVTDFNPTVSGPSMYRN